MMLITHLCVALGICSEHALIGGVTLPFGHYPNSDVPNNFELSLDFETSQAATLISTSTFYLATQASFTVNCSLIAKCVYFCCTGFSATEYFYLKVYCDVCFYRINRSQFTLILENVTSQ